MTNVTLFDRQRRFPRYTCSYAIAIVDRAGTRLQAECRSLSRGGFGASVSRDLVIGTIVSIFFKPVLLEHEVCLTARVLYRAGELYGFEFIAPGENQRELIAALFKEAVAADAHPTAL